MALGAWVHRVRKQGREGRLPPWQMAKLDELLFVWKVDQHSAKWHYTLHEARRFKVGAAIAWQALLLVQRLTMFVPALRACP